jgi:hypothetical protein
MRDQKQKKMSQSPVRWCDFPGQRLVKSVSIEFGGVTVASYRACKTCGNTFEYEDKEAEFHKLRRLLCSKEGDLQVCMDCDKIIPSAASQGVGNA